MRKKKRRMKMETSKLEVYITQKDAGRGVYISFPTTRQALRRAFKKAHISLNDWKIAALKTGSDVFSEAVLACRNLDELNLLGFWLSQLSEKQYDAFFRLCDAGCAEGNRMADCGKLPQCFLFANHIILYLQ